jgi:hypothetical protein
MGSYRERERERERDERERETKNTIVSVCISILPRSFEAIKPGQLNLLPLLVAL